MAFCRLIFPLLVLSVVSASNVPVFLWGLPKSTLKSNPLTTVTGPEFKGLLKRELANDPFVVVFVEESLSVEDISSKNSEGETPFSFLHRNLPNSLYLPSVENALRVLNNYAGKADHVKLTENGLSGDIDDYNNKVLFISLKDAKEGESRNDMLRRHNDLISDVFEKLGSKYDDIVGIYTARNPSWTIAEAHSRARRQASEPVVSSPDYLLNGLRLYVKEIMITTGNTTTNITGFVSHESSFNNTVMSTEMIFDNTNLTLNFRSAGGYWFFDTVTLKQTTPTVNEQLYSTSNVEALLGFSYRCKQFVSFTSVNETIEYTLTFEDIKVQPFFETTNETVPFGDSFNCVGFFSAPIWSGLFVVFILLGITFYGIMMMLDIRTMDRFDDPKGKTITINAGE